VCGLVGSYRDNQFAIEKRLSLIGHRGPDSRGFVEIDGVMHGHVRLALLDLSSAADQPFKYKGAILAFNGEIWNHQEIRKELGGKFKTGSDTETLAAALYQWGIDALSRLEGMFAFSWSHGGYNILARDRFGKIPLYINRSGETFRWSSERKGLAPYTCTQLPAGTWLDLETGKVSRWYSIPREWQKVVDIGARLEDGVRARLLADAPLCCLISGGLDSSMILAYAKKHKRDIVAYTARLDHDSHDLINARRVADHFEVPLTEVDIGQISAGALTRAAMVIEIPSKAQIEIAALCIPLAQAISSDGFKACLSGEAADELFGGYGSMCIKGARASDNEWRNIRLQQIDKMARGNFVRCNKAFMAYGIECRLPFMDRALVEGVVNLRKADCPPGKKALKKAASGIIPESVIKRPKDTFQGGSGVSREAAKVISNPGRFYRAEIKKIYGKSAIN